MYRVDRSPVWGGRDAFVQSHHCFTILDMLCDMVGLSGVPPPTNSPTHSNSPPTNAERAKWQHVLPKGSSLPSSPRKHRGSVFARVTGFALWSTIFRSRFARCRNLDGGGKFISLLPLQANPLRFLSSLAQPQFCFAHSCPFFLGCAPFPSAMALCRYPSIFLHNIRSFIWSPQSSLSRFFAAVRFRCVFAALALVSFSLTRLPSAALQQAFASSASTLRRLVIVVSYPLSTDFPRIKHDAAFVFLTSTFFCYSCSSRCYSLGRCFLSLCFICLRGIY